MHEYGARRTWIRSLALANAEHLQKLWAACEFTVAFEFVFGPETGLVLVRVALPAVKQPMILGDMTLTRSTIRLAVGQLGFGFAAGHAHEHATTAAICDALMQTTEYGPRVRTGVIEPLERYEASRREVNAAGVAATTMDARNTSVWNT